MRRNFYQQSGYRAVRRWRNSPEYRMLKSLNAAVFAFGNALNRQFAPLRASFEGMERQNQHVLALRRHARFRDGGSWLSLVNRDWVGRDRYH